MDKIDSERAQLRRKKLQSGEWKYSMTYDAFYDAKTREWTEPKCSDRECEFCSNRPELAP